MFSASAASALAIGYAPLLNTRACSTPDSSSCTTSPMYPCAPPSTFSYVLDVSYDVAEGVTPCLRPRVGGNAPRWSRSLDVGTIDGHPTGRPNRKGPRAVRGPKHLGHTVAFGPRGLLTVTVRYPHDRTACGRALQGRASEQGDIVGPQAPGVRMLGGPSRRQTVTWSFRRDR